MLKIEDEGACLESSIIRAKHFIDVFEEMKAFSLTMLHHHDA